MSANEPFRIVISPRKYISLQHFTYCRSSFCSADEGPALKGAILLADRALCERRCPIGWSSAL